MKVAFLFVAIGASLTGTGLALAQPPEATPYTTPYAYTPPAERPAEERGRIAAPKNAFELSIATGYTQGFGYLKEGESMPSVVTPGIGFDLGLGYRIDPNWAVLWAGQYQEFTAERVSAARGVTTSIAAQYHLAPTVMTDPWIELGAGYRFLWEDPSIGPTLMTHGIQLGRLRAGLDLRADKAVAVGPVIGADLNLFLFQDFPNLATNIPDPRVSTFIYAGLQGRFDFGGTPTMEARSIAKR